MIHILKIILNIHKKIYAFLPSKNNIFHIILNLPKYHNNSRYISFMYKLYDNNCYVLI